MKSNIIQNVKNKEKELIRDSNLDEFNKKDIGDLYNNENNINEDELGFNENMENKYEENFDEPIYVMTLALEQGKSEKIEIFANSNPDELAYDFCNKNNLDFNALDYLKEQISNLLESYAKEINDKDGNEEINISEIEEAQEDLEFNLSENYKEKTNTHDNNEKQIKANYNNENHFLNEEIIDNNELNNKNRNEINLKENNKNINNNGNEIYKVNSNNKNRSKKRNYKINEDIIIGIGDSDNKNNDMNKSNETSEKKELKKIYNKNNLGENKNISEQIITNNFNQETKTNTNNNIIQNSEEYSPKNVGYIYNNNKIESSLRKEKDINYKKINVIKPKEKNNKKNKSMRKIQRIKEDLDKKYSFKPIINDNYKTDLNFNQRMDLFNNISNLKKEQLKKKFHNLKDKENGQDFFKPKLISKQLSFVKANNTSNINDKENKGNEDIFNKNYLYWKKYNINKRNLYNKFYESKAEPKIYSKIKSEKIINETNTKAFSNLFFILDSDQDNLITSLSININNIPENILNIIEPLLIELKEDNQTLNQDEFIKAMNKLFENISFTKRRELIKEYSKYNTRDLNPILNNKAKIEKKKSNININTNKLAEKHFLKTQKMMDVYNTKYNNKSNSNKSYNSNFFHNYKNQNKKFSFINDCTFNNYLKNLN